MVSSLPGLGASSGLERLRLPLPRQVDARREEAAKVLRAAALKAGKPQLATLAERVRLDAFTKVKVRRAGMP